MQLPVVQAWYAQGLRFECTGCGNCCTGGPGYVWITEPQIAAAAEYLQLSQAVFTRRHCRQINDLWSINERRNSDGDYDCVFLHTGPLLPGAKKPQRLCMIYPVRPRQCRDWPFWTSLLASREAWDRAAVRCPGMNHGKLHTLEQIRQKSTTDDVAR